MFTRSRTRSRSAELSTTSSSPYSPTIDTTVRLLWEDRSVPGEAHACEEHRGKLFAVGTTQSSATGFDFSIRAYDARTGVLLWEDRFDGGAAVADIANSLSVAGGQLYVVGTIQHTAGDNDLLIRRYDPNTGALIWHQVFAGPAGEQDGGIAVAIGRHRVFVAGFAVHVPGVSQWAVQAYRASTGELVWSDYRDDEEVVAITARGDSVIAAGQQDGRAVVRAYDAATGNLLWDDMLDKLLLRGGRRHRPSLCVLGRSDGDFDGRSACIYRTRRRSPDGSDRVAGRVRITANGWTSERPRRELRSASSPSDIRRYRKQDRSAISWCERIAHGRRSQRIARSRRPNVESPRAGRGDRQRFTAWWVSTWRCADVDVQKSSSTRTRFRSLFESIPCADRKALRRAIAEESYKPITKARRNSLYRHPAERPIAREFFSTP